MSTKSMVITICVGLAVFGGAFGAWMAATAPPDNIEPWKDKQCQEYISQLEMVNKYKMFWSVIQRRVTYNDCLKRIEEAGGKPPADQQP